VNTHDTAFCAYTGGNYDGRFADAKKAARAAKAAESARKIRKAGQPTEIEREVEILKDSLLQQSQTISNAEKSIGSVVKRMENLEKRVHQLEWDNWKSNSELQQWKNWYNNSFDEDLDRWFFSSFAFTQQGHLMHRHVKNGSSVLGTEEQVDHNSGSVYVKNYLGYG
jgi:hypothetical protein